MVRRVVIVSGIVQGVGFRPFVHRLAEQHGLSGFVKNESGSVRIEIEGPDQALDEFCEQLATQPPPLAVIHRIVCETAPPRGDAGFRIESSGFDANQPVIMSPDMATCEQCLAELFDRRDRRFRYPFLNCTNCGPRLSIVRSGPYDRERTTMSEFLMCARCRAEYEDPRDRRFHAQPIACPDCGPRLQLRNGHGHCIASDDPLATFVAAIRGGASGAFKGLGGYHLVCDATSESAVCQLRERKHRDDKALAIMVRDLETASQLCEVNDLESTLLTGARRPIVLLRRRPSSEVIAPSVSGKSPYLGIILPYTPLHHLLLAAADMPLVMTSGNRSDEPIAYENSTVFEQLAGIADLVLLHNRKIHIRCDDSVVCVVDGQELPIRRSRGYAPQPILLPLETARPVLAVGGQLKGTFALGRGRLAFLSQHLGDLNHWQAYRAFERDVRLYESLFEIRPETVVHDLHPDYETTAYAHERAAAEGLETIAVQHHHAHVASCMAEHGLNEPVIGVSWDGTGYGLDGQIWGGEFLAADYHDFRRLAQLRYVPLPGGDRAVREPWRVGLAQLLDAGEDPVLLSGTEPLARRMVQQMIERRVNSPLTSSAGRLFDAVAAIAGLRQMVGYEGQAAVELQWAAATASCDDDDPGYPFELLGRIAANSEAPLVADTRPLIRAVAHDVRCGAGASRIARRFHSSLVAMIGQVCGQIRAATGLEAVVLTGGVFVNAILLSEAVVRLTADGFRVYRHRQVPCNDGGLSLGQLAIGAARQMASETSDLEIRTARIDLSLST